MMILTKQLKVSEDTHKKLMQIKRAGDYSSIDDVLSHLIEGTVNEYDVISREQTAITISYVGYGNVNIENGSAEPFDETSRNITFLELYDSQVGDKFDVEPLNYTYYQEESAEVIFKEDNFIVLRISEYDSLVEYHYDYLVGVNLL